MIESDGILLLSMPYYKDMTVGWCVRSVHRGTMRCRIIWKVVNLNMDVSARTAPRNSSWLRPSIAHYCCASMCRAMRRGLKFTEVPLHDFGTAICAWDRKLWLFISDERYWMNVLIQSCLTDVQDKAVVPSFGILYLYWRKKVVLLHGSMFSVAVALAALLLNRCTEVMFLKALQLVTQICWVIN